MANLKISQLTPGAPAQAADVIPIDRSGSNFSLTAGNIAALGTAIISTTKQGYLTMGGMPMFGAAIVGGQAVSVGQKVRCVQTVVPYQISITKCSLRVSAAGAAGATVTAGIYSIDGNTKLLDSGTFDGTVTTVQQKTGLSAALTPGVYWTVWSASTQTTLQIAGIAAGYIGSTTEAPGLTPLFGEAANSATAGVLPPTLGAITTVSSFNLPFILYEP